jgi:hypothetical protein
MGDNTILDLDAILDQDLASYEAAPDYQNPPPGAYRLKCQKAELKPGLPAKDGKDATSPVFIVTYEVLATHELAEGVRELPVANGTLFTERFNANETGIPYFKKQAQKILNLKDSGSVKIREMVEGLQNAEFDATLRIRISKKDGNSYENLVINPVHDTPPQ